MIQLNESLPLEWLQLKDLLGYVELTEGRDEVFWLLEKSKKYSTRSLSRLMTSGGHRPPNDDNLEMPYPVEGQFSCGWPLMTGFNVEFS